MVDSWWTINEDMVVFQNGAIPKPWVSIEQLPNANGDILHFKNHIYSIYSTNIANENNGFRQLY